MLSLLPSEILQDILYHVIELRHEIPISPSSKGRVPFRNKIDTTYHETENCHIYVERRSPSSLPPNSTLLVNHRLHDETLEVMKMKKPLQPFILDVIIEDVLVQFRIFEPPSDIRQDWLVEGENIGSSSHNYEFDGSSITIRSLKCLLVGYLLQACATPRILGLEGSDGCFTEQLNNTKFYCCLTCPPYDKDHTDHQKFPLFDVIPFASIKHITVSVQNVNYLSQRDYQPKPVFGNGSIKPINGNCPSAYFTRRLFACLNPYEAYNYPFHNSHKLSAVYIGMIQVYNCDSDDYISFYEKSWFHSFVFGAQGAYVALINDPEAQAAIEHRRRHGLWIVGVDYLSNNLRWDDMYPECQNGDCPGKGKDIKFREMMKRGASRY